MEALFHLSIPVDNLSRAKAFYVDTLGCAVGRKQMVDSILIFSVTI